jgi:hypothetical protein
VNHSDHPRVAILINYTQIAVRPMTTMGPFDDTFVENASDELRALLALDVEKALRRRALGHTRRETAEAS